MCSTRASKRPIPEGNIDSMALFFPGQMARLHVSTVFLFFPSLMFFSRDDSDTFRRFLCVRVSFESPDLSDSEELTVFFESSTGSQVLISARKLLRLQTYLGLG